MRLESSRLARGNSREDTRAKAAASVQREDSKGATKTRRPPYTSREATRANKLARSHSREG